MTGATGFVGRALVQRLLGAGHSVTALVRDTKRARDRLGPDVQLCDAADGEMSWAVSLSGCDAVVNLAGESLLGGPWTKTRRKALWSSRVNLTQKLVAAMALADPVPRTLISASAVGYYGERGSEPLLESSSHGSSYLAQMCVAWEQAAAAASSHGVRVVHLRIGIVLGLDGGALAAMLPAFKLGLGGPLGDGLQYMPWIHLEDLVGIILRGLRDERLSGAFNANAPTPVTSREFARALGGVINRPARLRVPAFALKLLLGARAQLPLQSQRTLPDALERLGHNFQHPQLTSALEALLAVPATVKLRRAAKDERSDLPRRPGYVLEHRSHLHVPLSAAFAFFCKAQNLGLLTPSWMRFAMMSEPPRELASGTELNYRIGLGPLPMRWKTIIERWTPPSGFVDTQAVGPYALWWHEHHLEAVGDETDMVDRVYYTPPFGLLGRLAHPILIAPMLRAIFAYRAAATERLFGPEAARVQRPAPPQVLRRGQA
ncbi:MAG: TIGR01777 family oxidoreductase [Polyangiales bacterium]